MKLRAATIASGQAEQSVRASQLSQGSAASPANANPNSGVVANAQVEALTIRAPMDGQLSALDAEVGQNKAAGAVLGQVNSADRFKLVADVDEFYLGRVNIGQETLFTIDGDNFKATVAKVYPQVTNGTFKVDFHFEGKAPASIHVGQAVDMRVELGGASDAVMLPNGPFYQDTGGNWVFVVAPGGQSAMNAQCAAGPAAIRNSWKSWMGFRRARKSSSRVTRPIRRWTASNSKNRVRAADNSQPTNATPIGNQRGEHDQAEKSGEDLSHRRGGNLGDPRDEPGRSMTASSSR